MLELPTGSSESYHVHRCESQSRVLTDACRRFPCILPCQGSEACAGRICQRKTAQERTKGNRTAEEEHVLAREMQQAIGNEIGKGTSKIGVTSWGAVVPQQEKENLGFDTRRRLCGDRNEGESVGAQEATGERVSNQSKHHRAGSTKSIKALNRRICWGETGILYQHDPRHVDVLVESLGLENGNTVQTPIIDDVKDENPVWLDPEQISKYRSHVARCLFLSQDRADITFAVNELCQRMSDLSQHSFSKLKRLVGT